MLTGLRESPQPGLSPYGGPEAEIHLGMADRLKGNPHQSLEYVAQ
jgi:hypothetical protein